MTHQLGTHSSPQGIPGGSSLQRCLEGVDLDFKRHMGVGMKRKACLGRGRSGNRSVEAGWEDRKSE